MLKLYYAGGEFELDHEVHDVAEVVKFMERLAPEQGGETWFKMVDGKAVHVFNATGAPYAIETDQHLKHML